jgi:hypothetical protein
MNYEIPIHQPFTNREFAHTNNLTVDAAEKWLRRRFECGMFSREHTAVLNPETKRKYWTFMYTTSAEYAQTRSDEERFHTYAASKGIRTTHKDYVLFAQNGFVFFNDGRYICYGPPIPAEVPEAQNV